MRHLDPSTIANAYDYLITLRGVLVHKVSRKVLYPLQVVADLTRTPYCDVADFYDDEEIQPYYVVTFDPASPMSLASDVGLCVDEDQLLVYILRFNPCFFTLDLQAELKKQLRTLYGVGD